MQEVLLHLTQNLPSTRMKWISCYNTFKVFSAFSSIFIATLKTLADLALHKYN